MVNKYGCQASEFDLGALDFEELGLALRNMLAVVEMCRVLTTHSGKKVAENHGLGDIAIPDALLCVCSEINRALKMLGPYGSSWNEVRESQK